MIKIGIIKEGKVPPDHRVPLSPEQCAEVKRKFPQVEVKVQSSNVRKYKDEEYTAQGIDVVPNVEDCDFLFGVKEVPIDMLIPNKTYLFFSHTLKKQPYNAKLLRAILDKKIRLIDYEAIKDEKGKRLIGFGRYAGIVGAYHGWRTFGLKNKLYDIKRPYDCEDRKEMEGELSKVKLPSNMKLVVTGFGRVGNGAKEIIDLVDIKKVSPEAFLNETFDHPVYVHLDTAEYYHRKSDGGFDKKEFYAQPELYESCLAEYVTQANMYIACHLWNAKNPNLITASDISNDNWKCNVIADISCDIAGPIVTTLRPSKISDPIFGVNRFSLEEIDYNEADAIAVMSVDNLPCELPKDASEDFGSELINNVLPALLTDASHPSIWGATETTLNGELTAHFEYLKDYSNV